MIVRLWPNFRFFFSINLEEMTKAKVKISENSQCLNINMKQIRLEKKCMRLLCESELLQKKCGLIQRSTNY